MISEVAIEKVYLAQRATDLRKSIDRLAAIVKEEFELDSFFLVYLFFVIAHAIN